MNQTVRVQKLITFSPQLYQVVMAKAKQVGLSFGEYIRHLVVIDVKEDMENLPMMDKATDKLIGESLEALREGKYMDVDASNEVQLRKALGMT